MMLLATVCLLLFLSHARAQGCSEILISDLGSTVTAGTGGAIAQLFSSGETGSSPDVLVMSSRTVCLAAAVTRGNYRFASVITTYSCGGPAAVGCPPGPYPRTDQFEFGCVGSVWQDSALFVDDRNDPVNPSITTLRRDCSFCISPDDATNIGVTNPVDTETHCAACDPSCLTGNDGLGYCTNILATGCCNVYQPMNGVNTCAVSCDTGFEADPPLFLCESRCPELPPPLNGAVSHPTRTVGSVATYTCDTNFTIVGGDEMRTCGASSAWDGEELDCSDCPTLPDPNDGMVDISGMLIGDTATYTCNTGFFVNGDEVRTCQGSGWNSTAPTCDAVEVEMCDVLTDPVNGNVNVAARTAGSVASYTCEIGYNLIGNSSRTCQGTNGLEWSGTEPICQIVDCGDLTPPLFGQINLPGTTFGSAATYSCNGDRELTGDMTRTCQANGTWSGTSPECGLGDLTMDPDSGGLSLHSATSSLIFLAVGVFVHLACQ